MPARLERTVLATCCVPWDEHGRLMEPLFRRTVSDLVADGVGDLYVFGTAGEGHAVGSSEYREIVDAFLDEMRCSGREPMVGVIGTSLRTTIERIEHAFALGCRRFQLSLPPWGTVNDQELQSFFRETCGRFDDAQFLHYNLARSGRLLRAPDYAPLVAEHPNLVATKYGGGDPELIAGLMLDVPELCHFFTESGFLYGSMLGECGLLASISASSPRRAWAYFDAARTGDWSTAASLGAELAEMLVALRDAVGPGPHLDGAFDKIVARLYAPDFPLRLLPPWEASSEAAFEKYARVLRSRFPEWLPNEGRMVPPQ